MASTPKAAPTGSKTPSKASRPEVVLAARAEKAFADLVKKRAEKDGLSVSGFVMKAIQDAMNDAAVTLHLPEDLAKIVKLQSNRMKLTIPQFVQKAVDQAVDPNIYTYQVTTTLADQIIDLSKKNGVDPAQFVEKAVRDQVSRMVLIKPKKEPSLAEFVERMEARLDQISTNSHIQTAAIKESSAQIQTLLNATQLVKGTSK